MVLQTPKETFPQTFALKILARREEKNRISAFSLIAITFSGGPVGRRSVIDATIHKKSKPKSLNEMSGFPAENKRL